MDRQDPIHIVQVIVRYSDRDEVKELVFGERGFRPIPCSIYFGSDDLKKAYEAIGGNNAPGTPPTEDFMKRVGGERPMPRTLGREELEQLGLGPGFDNHGWGPGPIDRICWHYCPCDWDCGPDRH